MNEQQRIEFQQKIIFGIGDLAQMTGVSPRQLRYWEEKGYIQARQDCGGGVRKYGLRAYFTVASIKEYLDQGYTLATSVKKAELSHARITVWNKFTLSAKSTIEVTDFEKGYGQIDFGTIEQLPNLHLYGIVDENGSHIRVSEEEK